MQFRNFKPEMLLIIILPITLCMLGGIYLNNGTDGFWGSQESDGINQFDIYIGTSILTSVLALFVYLKKPNYTFISAVILSILFSMFISLESIESTSIALIFLPLAFLSASTYLLLNFVFYNQALIRMRTFLFAVGSGVSMTIYFAIQTLLLSVPLEQGFWVNRFVLSLLLYIFIALGLSFSDLIITRLELIKQSKIRRRQILNDEIEDDEDDDI